MADFRKLLVWQKAHGLALRADDVAKLIARSKPGLARQLERAADAVPAAIAEGRGRATDADFAHYCSMAIGSVTEVENHLQRGYDGGVISKPDYAELTGVAIEVRRMLIGLRRTLRGQPRGDAARTWLFVLRPKLVRPGPVKAHARRLGPMPAAVRPPKLGLSCYSRTASVFTDGRPAMRECRRWRRWSPSYAAYLYASASDG